MTPLDDDALCAAVARTILDGFDRHYRLFREVSAQAKSRFERGDWEGVRAASVGRIPMYDQRVAEAVSAIAERYPRTTFDLALWPRVKLAFIGLLHEHRQPECAETFYNSVACRVLRRTYYHNDFIFWRPAVSTEHLVGDEPAFRSWYPGARGLRRCIEGILASFRLSNPWANLPRDVRLVLRAIRDYLPPPREIHPNFQIQVLGSLFFRNKAAYLVGRIINGNREIPFVVPILRDERGRLYLDALLLHREDIAQVFSLAHAYFMVDVEVPSATVRFLKQLMPPQPRAELYTLIGLQKQGKTLFYRDLHEHLTHSTDRFVTAPGQRGMVMQVFTLPSFHYVFKVIRDWFAPPKDTDRGRIEAKYLLVKQHDRVGRLADTLEYSDVAFPIDRFDPALIDELSRLCPSSVERDGARLVIKHLYIERRMVPLDLYLAAALRDGDTARVEHGVREYGDAIRELASANIFPGDLLLKNFGVTRHGRVVFYDYDEICYLTECRFRRLPRPRHLDEEMAAEPWFSVGPNDVFPEELPRFVFAAGTVRDLFYAFHRDLTDAAWWQEQQRKITAGVDEQVFPYSASARFPRERPGAPAAWDQQGTVQ